MKKFYVLVFLTLIISEIVAQKSDSLSGMNMEAVYNRPFLTTTKAPVSVGGYIEANTDYFGSDGVTEGLSFRIPRLTVFMSANINTRIKFLTEIEFEEGGKEIAIEFAAMDVTFHPLLNLRGGIVMNPIGAFNQNHDGPKWEFVDRPIAATTIVPSTWSNVGFGLFGKMARDKWIVGYEAYLTNGFDDTIINNGEGRTWLAASKESSDRFEESFNGEPLTTLKLALRHLDIGEIGISWMGGIYNKHEDDGLVLDEKRRLDLLAVDLNTSLPFGTQLIGEFVWASIDVPNTYSQQFGSQQEGGFLDIVHPIWKKEIFNWPNAVLNLATRLEYTDYNVDTFDETGGHIFDHIYAFSPAISFRPSYETVFRFNYRMMWERDLLGNPATKTVGYQFGFSTYF